MIALERRKVGINWNKWRRRPFNLLCGQRRLERGDYVSGVRAVVMLHCALFNGVLIFYGMGIEIVVHMRGFLRNFMGSRWVF